MRWVRHPHSANKRLFPYNDLLSYNDCEELIVCLSERSLNIILNALTKVEEMRTRVWIDRQGDLYEMANDEQFETFRRWTANVYNELGSWVMCNEQLERIADALEAQLQAADEQTVNLVDVFDALGLDPTESEADILEALEYLITFPGMPGVPKLPLGQWIAAYFESRYKSAHLQLLRDMAISQRGMAVAQGGVDFAALWDNMGETVDSLLVKAGFLGKAYWLWRWVDNDQLAGWTGWLTSISGALLGSIRNAVYDVATAIDEKVIPDPSEAISLLDLSCPPVTINVSSGSGGCCNLSGDDDVTTVVDIPTVTTPDRGTFDPPNNIPTWEEFDEFKCNAIAVFISQFKDTLRNWGGLAGFVGGLTIAVIVGVTLISMPPTGLVILLAALSGILTLDTVGFVFFTTMATFIEGIEEDILCELYNVDNTEDARTIMEGHIDDAVDDLTGATLFDAALRTAAKTLLSNSYLGKIYDGTMEIPEGVSVDCSGCAEAALYTIEFGGVETSTPAGNSNPIEGQMTDPGGWGCSNAREFAVNDLPAGGVTVTDVTIVADGAGECSGVDIYHYFSEIDYTTAIFEGSSDPSVSGPVAGVRSMWFLVSVTSGTPTISITYTVP